MYRPKSLRILLFILPYFLLISAYYDAYAQRKQKDGLATVMGVITEDSKDHIYTIYTNVSLVQGKDTLNKVITNKKFVFEGIKPGKIKILISNVAFEPQENTYEVIGGNNMIYIKLKEKENKLKEAVVSAETQIMREIKDTIIYNATAVNTMEGDNAIEIFKQLPGAAIEDGKFLVFGEEIKRTYVNGVLIYGENPDESMNALLAKEVVNMKVYDEDNLTDVRKGIKNARKEKVMNIITYSDIMSAIDAYAIAGYGIDTDKDIHGVNRSRYNGGLTAAYYSEMLKLKIEGQSNNIGRTENQIKDITSVSPQMKSYKEGTYALLEGEKYWKDRQLGNSLIFSYRYNKDYVSEESYSSTRYFPTEDTPQMHYIDSSVNSNVMHNHHFRLFSNLQNTPLKQLVLYADGNLSNTSGHNYAGLRNNIGNTIYRQSESDISKGGNKGVNAKILWSDNDGWGNALPSISIMSGFSDNRYAGIQIDTTESSCTRRILKSESVGKSMSLSGTFKLSSRVINEENLSLSWHNEYIYIYDRHKNIKTTYDLFDVPEPVINLSNTHDYTYNVQTHALTSMLTINTSKKLYMDLGVEAGVDIQTDNETFPLSSSFSKNFWFINPSANISYKGLKVKYNIKTDIPSIEQLRNRINDSNPLMLIAGNPNLKQSKTGLLDLTWGIRAGKTGILSAGIKFRHSWDAIVSKMTFFSEDTFLDAFDYTASAGSSLYSYTNIGGKIDFTSGLYYMSRVKKIKGSVTVNANYRFGRQPQYIGNNFDVMYQHRPGFNIILASSPTKWIKPYLSVDLGYIYSENSHGQLLLNMLSQSVKADVKVNFLKNAFLDTSYRLESYIYLNSTGKNHMYHHLNAVIGYKMMDSRLILSLSSSDILRATSNYTVTTTSNFVKESWIPYTGRYVMFNIYYRFNKTSPNKY